MAELKDVVSNRVKSIRKKLRVTQEEMASMMGLTRNSIEQWERGLYFPKLPYLIQIAELGKCSVDYLLGLTEEAVKEYSKPILNEPEAVYTSRLSEVKTELDHMKRENITLKELIDSKNEIIEMLKKKLGEE